MSEVAPLFILRISGLATAEATTDATRNAIYDVTDAATRGAVGASTLNLIGSGTPILTATRATVDEAIWDLKRSRRDPL